MKLTDSKLFKGQSETITLSDLRTRPGDVFQQVQMGKTFHITKSGKCIAQIEECSITPTETAKAARPIK